MSQNELLILASGSPRRVEFLTNLGIQFTKQTSNVDEAVLPDELPKGMVKRLSVAKAEVIAQKNPGAWVVGADTTVSIDDHNLGKPESEQDAFRMLSLLRGRAHQVFSAFTLLNKKRGVVETQVITSEVTMHALSDDELWAYIKTGDPFDKAGAYAVQDHGAHFIKDIRGSYSNVMGLDIGVLRERLLHHGIIKPLSK